MIGAAMTVTSTILLLCVLGTATVALAVDLAAVATLINAALKRM